MPRLEHHKDLRRILRLPFCYVCGGAFAEGEKRTRDHVPARACFARADRTPPLLLPTHEACDGANKLVDEKVGRLIGLGRGIVPKHARLKIRTMPAGDGGMIGGVTKLDIDDAVKRWIRAFHAALYG